MMNLWQQVHKISDPVVLKWDRTKGTQVGKKTIFISKSFLFILLDSIKNSTDVLEHLQNAT